MGLTEQEKPSRHRQQPLMEALELRQRYTIAISLLTAIFAIALAAPAAAEAQQKRVVTVKPSKVAKRGVVYRVQGNRQLRVRGAKLILSHSKRRIVRRVGLRKVRRGMLRGTVRLRLPRAYRRILLRSRRAQLRRQARESRSKRQQPARSGSTGRSAPKKKVSTPAPKLVISVEPDQPKRDENSSPSESGPTSCSEPSFGKFGAGAYPASCWRPYNDSSPFNQPLPASPRLAGNSSAIVNQLVSWGKVQNLIGGHSGSSDYGHPIYYSQPDDPVYKVNCEQWVSSCQVHGLEVRIPRGARPAGGGDGHLAVIDQSTGVEYDFWQVRSIPPEGGTLSVSHGGITRIDGDGLGSNATAAHFGLAAGIIRGEEMFAGEINHALFAQVKCTSGRAVAPAAAGTSGASCSQFGISTENAPPMGTRLWLSLSEGQIEALPVPDWRKTILKAMSRYGVIIGDTMGGNSSWGLQAESGEAYTSFGIEDPWDRFGAAVGAPAYKGGYVFDIDSGVDWTRYLKVVDPCVSAGSC